MPEFEMLDRLIHLLSEQERAEELATVQDMLSDRVNQIEQLLWILYQSGQSAA